MRMLRALVLLLHCRLVTLGPDTGWSESSGCRRTAGVRTVIVPIDAGRMCSVQDTCGGSGEHSGRCSGLAWRLL